MLNFNLERLKRLPQRQDTTWQGGWYELTDLQIADQAPGTSYHLGMWTSVEDGIVGPGRDMLHTGDHASAEKLLDLLAAFAADPDFTGYRPGTIEVVDADLAQWLDGKLGDCGITVNLATTLPAWELAAGDFESRLNRGPRGTASISLLDAPDLTTEQVIEFGEAAAEFHAAAKWHEFCDQDLFRVVSPPAARGLSHAVILGWSSIEYGLGFYDTSEEHDRLQSDLDPSAFMDRDTPLWLFTFNDRTEKGYRDLFYQWSQLGMPLAGEKAYPLLLCREPDGTPRVAEPQELEFLTGLLLALARTETTDAEQGRWTVTVPVGGRQVDYTLELPHVLKPLGLADMMRWNIQPDSRANEQLFDAIGKLVGDAVHDDPESAAKEYNDRFMGRDVAEIVAEAGFSPTSAREADTLCFEAYDTIGFRKQILARRALAIDPNCIRAWNLLGGENSDLQQRLVCFQRAVAVAHERYDPKALQQEWDDLNGCPEYRPALRALAGATTTAEHIGRLDEAAEYALEYLTYSPSDPAELRHFAVGRLLAQGRTRDAERLLAQWPPEFLEPATSKPYLAADNFMGLGGDHLFVAVANLILTALDKPENDQLVTARQKIRAMNRYVLAFLDKGQKPPRTALENFTLKGGAVALLTGTELADAWRRVR